MSEDTRNRIQSKKIFAIHIIHQGLISRLYKELPQIDEKNTINGKKQTKDMNMQLREEENQIRTKPKGKNAHYEGK